MWILCQGLTANHTWQQDSKVYYLFKRFTMSIISVDIIADELTIKIVNVSITFNEISSNNITAVQVFI